MTRLVITNGDSAADCLKRSGLDARILPWRDVLHDGPMPTTPDLESLSKIRAAFLATTFDLGIEDVQAGFEERDQTLIRHGEFERVSLWFEHDLYDQLQLLQILGFFHETGRVDGIFLVQIDTYLGFETKDSIRRFELLEAPVTPAQMELAASIFNAFRQDTLEAFAASANLNLSALPYMKSAIRRGLEELPHRTMGLSRTQHQMLHILDRTPATPESLFAASQKMEEAIFMGDWSFWRSLEELALNSEPLIDGLPCRFSNALGTEACRRYRRADLTLSATGRAVLGGDADHAALNHIDRWLGGTHINGDAPWRWDPVTESLLPPQ